MYIWDNPLILGLTHKGYIHLLYKWDDPGSHRSETLRFDEHFRSVFATHPRIPKASSSSTHQTKVPRQRK